MKWWKEGIIYQIYPRSFFDSSGNGIGDLNGISKKLHYIKSLGVDMVWICPFYKSPNKDNGYDISDYKDISKIFGDLNTFDTLLKKMHSLGLKLIMDLVVNHTSDKHPWFKKARKSRKSKFHDYYIWKDGEKDKKPNNWKSVFSGSAWKWNEQTKEYFLHLYTKNQPDLNWENPTVRKEVYSIIDFWLSKGVDGIRMDVISLISKRLDFKNIPNNMIFIDVMEKYYANGPRVHEYIKEMNKKVLSKYDIVTIGEGPGINLNNGLDYVNEDENELNMIFHFDHLTMDFGKEGKYDPIPFDFIKFKKIFSNWDKLFSKRGWNSIFLGNHDFSRIVSRFGNDNEFHEESSKLLATLLMTLRGTPSLYQGDEIGMTNVDYSNISFYDDVETINAWKEAIDNKKNMKKFFEAIQKQSRDNARTPMQWDNKKNAGFSKVKPWIKVNDNYKKINVKNQEKDLDSILNYYKLLIKLRKENSTLVYGKYEDLGPMHTKIFSYKRWDENDVFIIHLNFSNCSVKINSNEIKDYKLVISNYTFAKKSYNLNPWEARIYKLIK
ncbi:MAG: alpha-glucosidase [Bacteroidota bacterium]|nr:glucohydrolase [Flavobacteriaceae bacterium]MEC8615220.1 alpha-glucosidase [Bacteroidota bacterium]